MAAYDITAPDGKTYRLDGPAGASKIDLINALAAKYPMAVQTTEELEAAPRAPSSAGNLFKGLSSAVLGGTKSLVDVTGAGTGISKSLGEASQFLESKMTPERQEEMQRRQELIERANRSGSLLKEAKAYLGGVAEAPLESTVRGIGSSAPSIIAGLAALPLEAPAALALGVSAISRIAVGAAQGVGEYKGGVFDTVKAKYMEAGYKEPEAERLAIKAQEYSADKALELGGSALLGALDAYTGVEAAATGAFKKVARPNTPEGLAQTYKGLPKTAPPLASPNILGSAARSVAGEAPIEGLQGGFGQFAQNLAVSKEGFEQAPFEGVLGSSLRDAAVGALVGGTFTPLNHAQRSRDFALDQYLRTQGPIAVAEQERATRRKEIEDANALTKEQLGIKAPPLMLEGPKDKLFKPDEEILRDPVGRITRNELGNALQDKEVADKVTGYIDSYRSKNNLPPLQTFSLEDIKDAMTSEAPAGELGALQSILTYKTGFNNETISADDVLNAAEAKEIATGTQGFKDFLERATGSSDLDTMSDVQRFSAFKALSSLNKRETGRETVLRPGTNASRFTQDQFDEGLTTLGVYLEQNQGKVTMPEAIKIIKAQTSLKTDRDAYTLLNNAAAQNFLNLDRGEVFNVVDRNGDIVNTFTTEDQAKASAGKKDTVEKQTGELVSVAELPKAKAPLPKGYAITKQTVEDEVTPAGYAISAPDAGKPLTIVEQVEDLKAKVEQMEGARQAEANKELTGALRIQQALQQRSDSITKMEALGQTDTLGYKKLKNQQVIAEREFSKRIQSLLDRAERLKAPLKTKPVGRNVKPKDVYTLTKDGKTVGKFKNEDEAYASMFLTPEAEGGLSDKELEDIAVKGGNLGDRAFKAIEARQTKGFKVKTTPETRVKAEFQAKADEIAKNLLPMLKRFGLEDVGLKIVNAIENGAEGSYLNSLIEIAVAAGKQVETLRHESLHALKDLGFFTDAQWKSLERQADAVWIDKYLRGKQYGDTGMTRYDAYYNMFKKKGYNPAQIDEAIREEAIADAFADFSRNKPPAGMIASLLARLNNFFTALRNALNGAGFNTADDIFEKIEAGELKSTKKGTATAPKYNLRDYKMELEKEERVVGKAASLSDQEIEGLTKDAEQAGLTPKEYKAYAKEAKRIKKQFPLKDGWAPLELVGLTIEKDEDTGAVKTDLKWKAIPYAFNRPYGFDKAPQKIDKVWGDKVADEMFKLVDDIYQRAAKGDKNAQIIIGHQTWYRNVADILRREYGAQGDLLADLLGATSPNTPVNTNWKFSIDILRRFMKGEFDADLRKFDQYVAEGKPIFKYPAADKIRQVTGMLYGMNSTNAMKALLDMWRVIEAGTAPKARNFALNLIGQSNMATIDVWAARMLRRATNMIRGMDLPRIPPPAEKGVTGKWNSTATSVTGEFGFGDYVMQEVSKRLNSKGYNVTAPDLQAIAWFAEKELWGKKKWTTVTGEGGSFEENIEAFPVERYLAGWSIQQGDKVPEKEDVSMAQAEVMSMLAGDDSVVSARVMPTLGLYGDTIENSFDTEWTVEKDKHDPSMVMATIAKISERENQYDIFVSKVLSPKEESLNARPGVEIYFKNNKALKDAMPVLEAFTTKGQDGFTMAVDPRSRVNDNYIGVRLQYVPEISMRWDEDLRKNLQDLKFLVNELKTKADALADIAAQVSTMDGVAYSALQNYDTVVVGKENYDEYIDRAASASDRTTRSETWFGTPIRQAIKRAASRLNGEPRENVARGVSTPSSTETKYSLGTYFPTAKAAEDAAYAKGPPQTREFKVFFGASKAMEEGRAQPMFHASTEEFDIFRENKPIFVSPEARFAEDFIKRRIEEAKSLEYLSEGKERVARIYPLWVRAETPFDYENADHVRMVMEYLYPKLPIADTSIEKEVKDGLWSRIEETKFQAALKALGFDSFQIKEDNIKQLAVFKANQVKSITGNIGEFNPENKSIKYSLPTISAAAQKRVNEATTVTEPKTRFESITEAVFPRSFSYFRQEAINRYNQLSVYDKTLADQMGGKDLLASVSAEQGALFSDLDSGVLASVMGVGNRQGGMPVYRNGITTVDTSVKGLTEVFAPLAKYRDPVVFQHYQFWAAVKRGLRLIEIDKERNIQASDKIIADELQAKYPEFVDVQKDWITFNNGVVKYLVDTNVLSQERANEYMKYADYIPFYRQLDGRETLGPKVFQSLTTVKPPREIHGSNNPLADFLETVVRNTHASIRAGMKNSAALKAVNVAGQVKAAGMGAEKVVDANGNPVVSQSPDTFTVFEKGEKVSYRTPDALLISALTSLNMPELPFMGLISAPANALRNLVTKDPGFMMVNLMRDSLSAYVTSGVNILPIAGSAHQFVKGLMKQSPTMEALLNAGIGGGYEFSQNIERSGANLYADLQKKAGNAPKGLTGLATGVWDALETGTTASDMATRALIYERVMKETGDEAEALKRALEVMNFNRKGRSAVVRILTAAVPFLNARIQGLDVFFRAGVSPTYRSLRGLPVTDQEKAVMRRFWIRGSTMMALSVMYYFAVSDDDEYKKQEQETKDNYWIIPSTKIKIATPFEVGTLFKTIPERIVAYATGNDTGEDFRKAMYRAFNNTIPISPTAYIPQVFKPLLEYSTNFNFFTMRPIVGQGMEGIDAKYQTGPSTSLTFQELGKTLGVSPLKAEQMYKGYTGTIGMYLIDVMDAVMEASGSNPQATKRFEQLPIIKRFALDTQARGDVTAYYELRNSVHTAVATANMLERSDPKEFIEYFKENKGLLANKDYVNDLYKTLKQFNDMRRMVNTSTMSGDEKRAALTNINFAEQNLTKNIQVVKKAIASTQ